MAGSAELRYATDARSAAWRTCEGGKGGKGCGGVVSMLKIRFEGIGDEVCKISHRARERREDIDHSPIHIP